MHERRLTTIPLRFLAVLFLGITFGCVLTALISEPLKHDIFKELEEERLPHLGVVAAFLSVLLLLLEKQFIGTT